MILAHGDQALASLIVAVFLIFGLPAVAVLLFRKRPIVGLLAFLWVCLSICTLLVYLILRHE